VIVEAYAVVEPGTVVILILNKLRVNKTKNNFKKLDNLPF